MRLLGLRVEISTFMQEGDCKLWLDFRFTREGFISYVLRKEFVRASGLEITAFVECIIIHTSLSSLKFQHFSVGAIVNRFQILSLPFEQKLDSKFGRFLPCKQDFGAIFVQCSGSLFLPLFFK